MKDTEGAQVTDWAIKGWMAYIQEVTKHEDPAMPVDERMALALTSVEEVPRWLEDALRVRLIAARGEFLVQRTLSRTSG